MITNGGTTIIASAEPLFTRHRAILGKESRTLGRISRRAVGPLLLATLAAGCLDYPRNNQPLASKTATVQFEGWWYNTSGAQMNFVIKNNSTNNWDALATATSGGSGETDSQNDTWYYFANDNVTLPTGSQYWAAGSGRTIIAQVQGFGPSSYSLTTYDYGSATDTCIQNNESAGGAAIMSNCKSAQSPIVTLLVPCGQSSQTCCLSGNQCDFGDNCSSGNCTAACGSVGGACCNASPNCSTGSICSSGTCIACGGTGQTCCSNSGCNSGDVCSGGTCHACGGNGQLCCASSSCNSGYACNGGTCSPCGAAGEQCCASSTCNNGDVCSGGTCSACGGTGQLCCSNHSCTGGDVCSGGHCAVCGGLNQPCCASSQCSSGYTCTGGTCQNSCAAWGTTCGSGVTCCAGTSCTLVPATSSYQCCNGIDPNTQTCN